MQKEPYINFWPTGLTVLTSSKKKEASITTLSSRVSASFSRHCLWSGETKRRALSCQLNENISCFIRISCFFLNNSNLTALSNNAYTEFVF